MTVNKELINDLNNALPFLSNIENLKKQYDKNIDSRNEKLRSEKSYRNSTPEFWGCVGKIILFTIGVAIIEIFVLVFVHASSDVASNVIFYSSLPIAIVLTILTVLNERKNDNKTADKFALEVIEAETSIKETLKSIYDKLNSDEGKWVQDLLPPDYFYTEAVTQFIYFLRNGHADTMKEAVIRYDELLHRQKIEYETVKAGQNADKIINALHGVNNQMAQVNKQFAEVQGSLNSIEFWSIYNAYLQEERYH